MENLQISELENTISLLSKAIDLSYAENQKGNFMVFEDLVYELCIRYQVETKILNDGYNPQNEADAAFYERFGHLGSI